MVEKVNRASRKCSWLTACLKAISARGVPTSRVRASHYVVDNAVVEATTGARRKSNAHDKNSTGGRVLSLIVWQKP